MQLHFRFSLSIASELFVETSKVRIAASNSLRTTEPPCIDVPPVILTFVFGAGEAFREEALLLVLKSEIKLPAAEGGGLGIGAWMASGLGWRVNALLGVDVEDEAVAPGRLVI